MAIEVMGRFTLDTSQPDAALEGVTRKEQEIENAKPKVHVDTHAAEEALESLKEKSKDIFSGIGAGALAGGAFLGVEKGIDAYKELLESQNKLKVAVATTGDSQDAVNRKFKDAEGLVGDLSEEFKKPPAAVRELVAGISGIGNVTGEQRKKVAEIGLAFGELNVPAKALKKILLGVNDPETAAAFDALKTQFPGLQTAVAGAVTSEEKLNAISDVMGGKLDQMKENAKGPIGQMFDLKEATEKSEQAFGSLIFGALSPILPLLTTLAGTVVAVSGFINENKTAILIAAGAYGVLRLSMAAKEVGGFATLIGNATKGAVDFGKSIVDKVLPGLFAKKTAMAADALATEGTTVAQEGLNVAMKQNPIGWIITGVMALVGVLVFLYDNVTGVKKVIDSLWTGIKSVASVLGSFIGITIDSGKALDKEGESAKLAGDAAEDGAKRSEAAQADLQKQIEQTTKGWADQQASVKQNVDNAVGVYAATLKRLNDGGAVNSAGVFEKDTDAMRATLQERLDAWKKYGRAQEDINRKNEAVDKKSKEEIFGPDGATAKKQGEDAFAVAKAIADEKARQKEIEIQLANPGLKVTPRQLLEIEQARTAEFQSQIKAKHLLDDLDSKTGKKTQAEVSSQTIKSNELVYTIRIDDEKAKDDLNKSIQSLTKKQIELGILPKTDGIKLIEAQVDELQKKLRALRDQSVLDPNNDKILAQINATGEQIITLEKEQGDARKSIDDALTNARIANIKNANEQAIQQRNLQFQSDLQFVRDAYNADRDLTAQELALKAELEKKYYSDIAQLRANENKNDLKLLDQGVNFVIESLKTEFAAKQKWDDLAYRDKKQQLDKQQGLEDKAFAKGERSAREYALNIEKINDERDKLEQQKLQAKWQNEEKIVSAAHSAIVNDSLKYASENAQAAILDAAGQKDAAQDHLKNAKATMLGAIATAIAGQITINPILGAGIGLAVGFALNAAFNGIEKSMGFATGGTWVGENGPEIVSPKKDFSDMVSLLVSSTAQEVRRSMQQDAGPVRSGRSAVRVQVSGQFKQRGRDMVNTLNQESIAGQNERLIHS